MRCLSWIFHSVTNNKTVKSKLINKAIGDIGMGRYNWQLFFLCGFGWFADNLWIQVRTSPGHVSS